MYTVTRQIQWPTGEHMVEVNVGGLDYCNPDALVERYPGEFQSFMNPVEAVETAIEICRAWRKDGEKQAKVGVGATGGATCPFESSSFKDARRWARDILKKLPRCSECGEIMEEDQEFWYATDFEILSDEKYCSERCANKNTLHFDDEEEEE